MDVVLEVQNIGLELSELCLDGSKLVNNAATLGELVANVRMSGARGRGARLVCMGVADGCKAVPMPLKA